MISYLQILPALLFIYLTPCSDFVAQPCFSSASNTSNTITLQRKPVGDRDYETRWDDESRLITYEARVYGHHHACVNNFNLL